MKRIATEQINNPTLAGDDEEHAAMRAIRRAVFENDRLQRHPDTPASYANPPRVTAEGEGAPF